MKETVFHLSNCEEMGEDEKVGIMFFPNKYFTSVGVYDDEFKGSLLSLRLISTILSNELINVVKTHNHYSRFVKVFFKHLVDIMYWVNKYKITEVYDFLRNMLTLRQPTKISLISNIEYIMINGGIVFIYRILAGVVSQIAYHRRLKKNPKYKNYIESIKHNLIKKNQDDKTTVEQFIDKHNDLSCFNYEECEMFKKIMNHVNFRRKHKYFKNLDAFPECDMNLVASSNQKVYSHFLWVYGGLTKYTYNLQRHELPNNDFYSAMFIKLGILPNDLAEMLKANLYVLSQVAA